MLGILAVASIGLVSAPFIARGCSPGREQGERLEDKTERSIDNEGKRDYDSGREYSKKESEYKSD